MTMHVRLSGRCDSKSRSLFLPSRAKAEGIPSVERRTASVDHHTVRDQKIESIQ